MGIVEDERGSRQPETTGELGNLFPPSQMDEFQLSQREHG